MARNYFPLVFLWLATPVAAQQQSLGIFGNWGVFQEKARCYAISEPDNRRQAGPARAFASIGYWPEKHRTGQLHVRLGGAKRTGSAVLLRIEGRSWQLVAGGADAWAADARADAEIVAAMRRGQLMTIETRSERGQRIRDIYRLRGAATAIDAAAIACARKK